MGGREEVRLGIRDGPALWCCRGEEKAVGGRMEASLRGFHVEEIHLLELIKI